MTTVSSSRINRTDALHLLRDAPLFELGSWAFEAKRARHGDVVTWVSNRHINPTNLCALSCRFCDFAAKPGDAHAYSLDEAAILEMVAEPLLREVHIVGGLWKDWGQERSLNLVRAIRAARPDLWIKAFTAVEVAFFAKQARTMPVNILQRMMEAGVDMLPGGGAEVLSERIHQELYPQKSGPAEWLAIHEQAHELGLTSNATLLFGHIETDEEIVEHLLSVRELQERTGGFTSFIPLAYQPGSTGLVSHLATPERCLRIVATARMVLDNVPHIKAYWPSLQVETAAAALNFGADDIDGTLGKERIMQLAGTASPAQVDARYLQRLIRDAGQEPRERDGQYNLIDEAPVMAAGC